MYCLCIGSILTSITHSYHFNTSISCSTNNINAIKIQNQNQSVPVINKNPVVSDYLVNTFGLSKNKAISVSNVISASASPSTLQIVPDFLKEHGFTDAQIRSIISRKPELLASSVDKILKPKLEFFHELGFTGSSLTDLFTRDPYIFRYSLDNYLIPNIDYFRTLLHSNENIVKTLKRHSWILINAQNVRCNIDILTECGVRNQNITCFLLRCPQFFARNSEWVRGVLARVEEFGIDHVSRLYTEAVRVIACLSKATVEAKFEVYKSYGWSQLDILSAFKKYPMMLGISERNIRSTMSFLIEEVGYEPKAIALRPSMLGCSLEKVLKPRNEVLNILFLRGLMKKKYSLNSVIYLSNKAFLQRYVLRYADKEETKSIFNNIYAQGEIVADVCDE